MSERPMLEQLREGLTAQQLEDEVRARLHGVSDIPCIVHTTENCQMGMCPNFFWFAAHYIALAEQKGVSLETAIANVRLSYSVELEARHHTETNAMRQAGLPIDMCAHEIKL